MYKVVLSNGKEVEYTRHPLSQIFPDISQADLEQLAESMEKDGQQHPILLASDPADGELKVADGWQRQLACALKGIEPQYEVWNGKGSLVDRVASLNQHRRHLTTSQRAMVAAKLKAAAGNDESANLRTLTTDELAHQHSVGTRTVAPVILKL